ncbi:uncharacterized protein LOC129591788 [Paramacrobiotus metropolitanus]|uniref:uncharacterized protein LOC129591788 n=1 Tax=Paramacrobiotus metropolitanus TaxID=2943436 RepID=UPI00244633E0|nr:uncharacterized protein LOC129591788 [Paramacrobiotus metropolitanus]
MSATTRYFRELWSGAWEVNYGNTVLALRDGGQWWLGYVQDVNGPHFLVDFDARSVPAQWIHSSRLWPHHFLYKDLFPLVTDSLPVALRDSHDGPMIFRPATIVAQRKARVLIVRLGDKAQDRSQSNTTPPGKGYLVYRNQCTRRLPVPEDGQNFFQRTDGLTFRKHVIPFPGAGALRAVDSLPAFVGRACQFALGSGDYFDYDEYTGEHCPIGRRVRNNLTTFYSMPVRPGNGFEPQHISYGAHVGVRVFVRAATDTLTFVCLELQHAASGRRMWWDEAALKKACRRYLRNQSALAMDAFPGALDYGSTDDTVADEEEMSISQLSLPILTGILTNVDAESQFRFSRVCALWREILGKFTDKRVVMLDMAGKKPYEQEWCLESEYGEYHLLATLDRFIRPDTETLLLMGDGQVTLPGGDAWLYGAQFVLERKGIRLRKIIAANGYDEADWSAVPFLSLPVAEGKGMFTTHALTTLLSVCDELVLVNYMASPSICSSARLLLFDCTGWHPPLEKLMRDESEQHLGDVVVVIPQLRFRRGERVAEQLRRFVAAAADSCPAVGPQVQKKVAAVYERWVKEVKKDRKWIKGIRQFFKQMDIPRPSGDPLQWDAMYAQRLRQLDVSTLNNLTLAALHGCYQDFAD